ncbi:MAG: purine-nucleoside phosphorylase [Eubacterium sp.]|nr:purine-nucleoside phosphorylase [Eubacterium sp.]
MAFLHYNRSIEVIYMLENISEIKEFMPETAIVLGSGLGALADRVEKAAAFPYSKISGFPVSTAPSHKGELVIGTLAGKRVAVFNGRVHLYEGYTAKETAAPVRLAKQLGIKNIILTNAAGGISKSLNCGDFMLIKDHISSFVPSPLTGKNDDRLGVRFPDMSNAYDKELRAVAKKAAAECGIELKEGVYAQLTGPQFETPAEIKMLSVIGADAVGMSTAVEAIAANHCGIKTLGISLISNLACGITDKQLSSEEVNEAADRAAVDFEKLICRIVEAI